MALVWPVNVVALHHPQCRAVLELEQFFGLCVFVLGWGWSQQYHHEWLLCTHEGFHNCC